MRRFGGDSIPVKIGYGKEPCRVNKSTQPVLCSPAAQRLPWG
jgi:hypothetical protein